MSSLLSCAGWTELSQVNVRLRAARCFVHMLAMPADTLMLGDGDNDDFDYGHIYVYEYM